MAIIVPEVFADAVNEAMGVSLRASKVATDFTGLVEDITLCGGEVHFPVIGRIGDAEIITDDKDGEELSAERLSMTDNVASVISVAKRVTVTDKEVVQVKGNLKDGAAKQVGEAMAKAVDATLIKAAINDAAYKFETANAVTSADMDALFMVFGDKQDNSDFAGIIISSKLFPAFRNMDAFTSVDKTYAALGNGIVIDGVVGLWNGTIPVILCDNGTVDGNKNRVIVVKKDALGIVWQKLPTIEIERHATSLSTEIVANEMFAAKLLNTDGVSVLTATITPLEP